MTHPEQHKFKERIEKLINDPLLDDWSQGFLESVYNQAVEKGYELSDRQKSTLNKIESRFSPQERQKLLNWAEDYKTQYREDAKIIANYYSMTSYFEDLSYKIMNNEDYVPDRSRFLSMFENKYAQGVLTNWKSEPKFADGQLVQVRKEKSKSNRLGFVLDSKQPISTHAKGGKRYSVLLFGETEPIIREERQLKKPTKDGKYL